jgi:hypothetical protein
MVQKFKTIFLLLVKEIHSYNIKLILSEKKKSLAIVFQNVMENFGKEILEELNLVQNMLKGDLPMNFIYKKF